MMLSRAAIAAILLLVSYGRASTAEAPQTLLGSWSPLSDCPADGVRHVFGADRWEWQSEGRRMFLAEASYRLDGTTIEVTLGKALEQQPVADGEGPASGDVITYRLDECGLYPLSLRHGAKVDTNPEGGPVFVRCAS